MTLPDNWRTHKSMDLEALLETSSLTEDEVDDLIDELANRDAQRAANAGAMNGVAPNIPDHHTSTSIEYPLEWTEDP